MDDNKKKRILKFLVYTFLIIGSFVMLMPFAWMLLTAFKSVSESTSMNPFVIFPRVWRFDNFTEVIRQNSFLNLYFNTFVMMFIRILCAVIFSAMAAYAFARLNFQGKNFFFR